MHDCGEDIDIAWLDRVINHIFASGLTLASVLSRLRVNDASAQQLAYVIDQLDSAVRELRDDALAHALQDRDGARLRAAWKACGVALPNTNAPHTEDTDGGTAAAPQHPTDVDVEDFAALNTRLAVLDAQHLR